MALKKTVVSPEPRKTCTEGFEDLEAYTLKKGEIGWIEKSSKGWIACIREEKAEG